jgi:prophage regulatory protein
MQEQSTSSANKIIRLNELTSMVGLSRSTIYDKQNPKSSRFDPLFPKKINLGARAVGYFQMEIEAWLDLMKNQSL